MHVHSQQLLDPLRKAAGDGGGYRWTPPARTDALYY
jgi:hypothetical protein